MKEYLPYKGLWWKIIPPVNNSIPMWRISSLEDDRISNVWMFNAITNSLEDCYSLINEEYNSPFKYIPIKGEYIIGVDVAKFNSGATLKNNNGIYELLSVRNHTPKYMGRGFFKIGHIFTNSNGVHLLSKLPSSLESKTYIRYDEEKPNFLDRINSFVTNKIKELKNRKLLGIVK